MEESISVAVRWRPYQQMNSEKMDLQKLHETAMGIGDSTFVFDQIMDNWSQTEVYTALVKPMVDKAVEGFDSTVLAYGQTGSGKTYTMGFENNENSDERGIIIRALEDLFNSSSESNMKVFVSFIEIYNEKMYDLLNDNPSESIPAKGHKTSTACKKRVYDVDDAIQILSTCRKNRRVRPTKMNPNSSRSHAILTIYVSMKQSDGGERKAALHLVDLAGSEGVRRTSHSGIALKEGNHINQGLLCIAKVVKALSTKAKVIPYRDTILTTALQDSLNLNSYLTMLACISPYQRDFNETMSTLRFLRNAKVIKINPQINSVINEYKKARTPIKQKPAETPSNTTKITTVKKLFGSPFLQPRPSSCFRSSTAKRASVLPRPLQRAATNLFPEPEAFENILERTFDLTDLPIIQSSPLVVSNRIDEPLVGKPAKRCAQRFMSVEEVNDTITNHFQTLYESHLNAIKIDVERQINELKEMIATNENRVENHVEVTLSTASTEKIRRSKQKRQHQHHQQQQQQQQQQHEFEDEQYNTENIAPNVSMLPAARRSNRISERTMNQSRLRSMTVEEPRSVKRSRKPTTFEEKIIQTAQLPQSEAIVENKRLVLNVLNTGNVKQLQKLSTIGPKTALKIWQYRNLKKADFESIGSLEMAPFWSKTGYDNFLRGNNLILDN